MMQTVPIALENCAKTFADGTRALEAVNLEIAAGETVVLLGPSGCGKTTTLRLIAGLEQPDAGGRVRFGADDVTALPIEKRNVGMVFQSYALFPNMTVAENIAYGLRLRRQSTAEQRARVGEMLALMRIERLAERSIDQLSGGQRQRVALARALAVQPRVLLLDEPLTALDAKLRDVLRFEIDSLLRELGITAIYVTHDQAEAMALGDRIVVMDHGRIAQVGAPREIYQQPASRYVAEFIGTMNRLSGHADGEVFRCAGGYVAWPALPAEAQEILFRPEDTRIAADGEAATLHGTVGAAFFCGNHVRLFVEVGEAQPLVLETPARREYRRGDPVALAVETHGLMVL